MAVADYQNGSFTPAIDNTSPLPDIGGGRITADRFTSPEYQQLEWPRLWRQVWNMGPRVEELQAPGDYVLHSLGKESFVFVRDETNQLRCFYNVCKHRGNRLVQQPPCGSARFFKCQFHGWSWNIDGSLKGISDAESFPQFRQGIPRDELALTAVRIDQWGGWVWFNIDGKAPPLLEYLGVIPAHLAPYEFEKMRLYEYKTFLWDCNWKTACDAFNESYHFRGLHPQMLKWSNDIADIELHGLHSRMINKYGTVSSIYRNSTEVFPELKQWMTLGGMDPDSFQGPPIDTRLAKQKYIRQIEDQVAFIPYKNMTDIQLSDVYHYFVFPNVVWNLFPEGSNCFRYRPHETDPNKMYYDLLLLAHLPADETVTCVHKVFTDKVQYADIMESAQMPIITDVLQQDADNVGQQQAGMQSESFNGPLYGDQEIRLRHFHNVLDAYMHEDPVGSGPAPFNAASQ